MSLFTREPATRLNLQFSRAEIGAGYLWLQYAITPVPQAVRARGPVRDVISGDAACRGRTFADCHCSYRIALDFQHVVGVVAVGPEIEQADGHVRVSFAPLAGTPGLEFETCEVEVDVHSGAVTHLSAHMC